MANIKKILGIIFLGAGIIVATVGGFFGLNQYNMEIRGLLGLYWADMYVISLYTLPFGIVFLVVGIVLFVLGTRKKKS